KQLNDLSEKAKDNKTLTAEIDRLKEANEQAQQEAQQRLEQQQKDFAIENALRDSKARNPKIAKNALNIDELAFKDGKLYGIDEQLEALKESDAYLFGEDEPAGLK